MSLVCCLDTNAILDMCYRYYPKDSFHTLWSNLESAVIAGQVSFIISEHISREVDRKIAQFKYPSLNYEQLLKSLKVQIIKANDYSALLDSLKGILMTDIPFISQKKSPSSFLEGLTEDLSNIALAQVKNAKVITSEQGFNIDIKTASNKGMPLKIPDVCTYQNVPCSNWLEVFDYLGMKL